MRSIKRVQFCVNTYSYVKRTTSGNPDAARSANNPRSQPADCYASHADAPTECYAYI
jgi:hypothetical protein